MAEFELKDFTDALLDDLELENVDELNSLFKDAIFNPSLLNKIITTLEKYDPKHEHDLLLHVYQFFNSNREELSQDFTPRSLAQLLSELTKGCSHSLDLCGGVGQLTIYNSSNHHTIQELDDEIIPYLLINLVFNNIDATVQNIDCISLEQKKVYLVENGEIKIKKQKELIPPKHDCVISNPPFNTRTDNSIEINNITFKNLLNYAFIERALEQSTNDAKIVFILPNGVLSSSQEKEYRKHLIDAGYLRAVITCPNSMFESTSIPVCVLYLDKQKTDKISFVDAREYYDVSVRHQKGEGSASHRNRTYKKNIAVFSEKQIQKIVDCIHNEIDEEGFSKTINKKEIDSEYIITPNRFVGFKFKEGKTRPYEDIINDINRIRREKNKLKLTCNKVWLKELNLDEVSDSHKESNSLTESTNGFLEYMDLPKLLNEDWIASSNSKILKWENKDKEELSSVLINIIPMWKQHIYYLNTEENRLLSELRDKLLPELMKGKIDVDDYDDSTENPSSTKTENTS